MARAPKKPQVRPGKPPPLAAFVSDPHIGNHQRHGGPLVDGLNRRGRETVDVFRRAVSLARERGAGVFVVCGDLFHTPRPEPAIIRAVQDVLLRETGAMRTLLIPGNHDMPDATAKSGNTAMAPLFQLAVIANEAGTFCYPGIDIGAIPFWGADPMPAHIEATIEWFQDFHREEVRTADDPRPPVRALAIHVGLWDSDDAAPWQRQARDGMEAEALLNLMRNSEYDVAMTGNYHTHKIWHGGADSPQSTRRLAVQVGTLCPHGHGDFGLENRGLVAFVEDDGGVTTQEIPGPRFLTQLPGEEPPGPQPEGYSYYVRCRGFEVVDADALRGWTACDVEPGDGPSIEAKLDAAEGKRAPKVETDEGAIEGYVGGMVLPDKTDRAKVVDLALDCWKRA